MTENNRIEYKAQLTDTFEKEVVAFLNYLGGGVIYIGIKDNGNIIGVEDSDSLQLKIKDPIKNNISPACMGLFDVVEEVQNNKRIIKIIVASGQERPYYIKKYGMSPKGCFIRNGSASEPMTERLIEDFFTKRLKTSIAKIPAPNQALKFEQLRIYYDALGKTLNNEFAKTLELLNADSIYNYVAYLMSDYNNVSVKIAKYADTTRVNLIQNEEFGFCSIIKATKQVLDKIDVENKTFTKITPKERLEKKLWNPLAIREAVINAFVHNDYTYELAPKFEIFSDCIEITSYGGLPSGITKEEFFQGVSIPRSKEIMRIFRDLDLVEQLGSGVPRILLSYDQTCFFFSDNFIRMRFPCEQANEQVTEQVTEQVRKLIYNLDAEMTLNDLMTKCGIKHRPTFMYNYLKPSLDLGLIERTNPDKPNDKNQKYRLTIKGAGYRY